MLIVHLHLVLDDFDSFGQIEYAIFQVTLLIFYQRFDTKNIRENCQFSP